jgi:hypothetical protein
MLFSIKIKLGSFYTLNKVKSEQFPIELNYDKSRKLKYDNV